MGCQQNVVAGFVLAGLLAGCAAARPARPDPSAYLHAAFAGKTIACVPHGEGLEALAARYRGIDLLLDFKTWRWEVLYDPVDPLVPWRSP